MPKRDYAHHYAETTITHTTSTIAIA